MRVFPMFQCFVAAAFVTLAGAAAAADTLDPPQTFVQQRRDKVVALLQQKPSDEREKAISKALEEMVDFVEVAHRAFGDPCPRTVPRCTNHWKELTAAQQAEITLKLRRVIEQNYKKNLSKTVDFDLTFKPTKDLGDAVRVRTEAQAKNKPHEPPLSIDYVLRPVGGSYIGVDIITHGSSLTKNYYDQFHVKMTTEGQGYAQIAKRLDERLASGGK